MKEALKGGVLFKLVKFDKPDEGIADSLFWRTLPGQVAASTFPVKFSIGGKEVIKPEMLVNENDVGTTYRYVPEGRGDIRGEAVLQPCSLQVGRGARHPAIQREGTELRILCAPVRFEAIATDGKPVARPVKILFDDEPLLRQDASFCPLIMWLPIGVKYNSNWATFTVTPEGKVQADEKNLAEGVVATPTGFRRAVKPEAYDRPGRRQPTPAEQTPAAELVETEGLRWFVTFLVKPGDPLVAGFSRKAFEKAAECPFQIELLTGQSHLKAPMGSTTQELSARLARPGEVPAGFAAAAARKLGVAADDVVLLAIPPPHGLLGAFNFTIGDKERKVSRLTYTSVIADASAGMQIISHRMRTSWEQGEQAAYYALVPKGFAGGDAQITCVPLSKAGEAGSSWAKPLALGSIKLPAVADRDFDSRGFILATGNIPPGEFRLQVDAGKMSASIPLTIVQPWVEHSPFFVHSMSGCYDAWPTDEEGLSVLRDNGMDMGTATGFVSMVNTAMPQTDPQIARRLGALPVPLPPESATKVVSNDVLLDRLLRHGIRMIDLAPVRALAFYMESLSYHHSYKPSVDRTVRRFQIFAQQTVDYPSWWGINHSWFPHWSGYSEGGVPTDCHTADRNRVLMENVKKAGFSPITKEEREFYEKNKFSDDADARDKAIAIMRQAVNWGRALEDFAYGKHNKLYNDAVREIKPDAAFALYENAGHDCGKRARALFNDMEAACYESYTDYGEWPMSAGFTTDWAKGNVPSRRVWLTVDWGGNYPARMKSLFHAFGRGVTGAGAPLGTNEGLRNIERSASGMKFIGEVGAIAARAKPDDRFAILATGAHLAFRGGHRTYDYHAMYYHLTRLGCPPVIIAEEDITKADIPDSTKVLFVVREEDPIDPDALESIRKFQQRGGKVLMTQDCLVKIDGAEIIPGTIRNIWDMSGFQGKVHGEMWTQFEDVWRKPLSDAIAKTGLAPLATTDIDWGVALTLDAEPMRYVVVIADKKGSHANDFEPVNDLPVSVLGTGWIIRDLVKQETLKTVEKDGRTVAAVNLITEPATVLACYKSAPKAVAVKSAEAALGGEFALSCDVLAGDGKPLGPVPVGVTIIDPAGAERETIYAAAGDTVRYPVSLHDAAGSWTIRAREMITGLTTDAAVTVAAAGDRPAPADITPIADVHVVSERYLRDFASHEMEKWVIVEPGQEALLPLAEKLTAAINESGAKARLWQVKPEEFGTIPLRWYPWEEDQAAMKLVEEGKLIGYRGNMEPFIDRKKGFHVPERGGWDDIDPPYMVGSDCIVFPGGRLAESLRAVSSWMNTPDVPGKGQGRLVVTFSPFLAGKMALAVVGNDAEGLAKAAGKLAEFFKAKTVPPQPAAPAGKQLKLVSAESKPTAIQHAFRGHTPLRRVARVLSAPGGKAVVCLNGKKDTVAFVDENGKITATVAPEGKPDYDIIDNVGNLWRYTWKATAFHPGWHYPTAHALTVQRIRPDGATDQALQAYDGDTDGLAAGWDFPQSFPVAPDGKTALLGRKGGYWLGKLGDAAWKRRDDMDRVRCSFEIRDARSPVGITFSPDSRYVLYTMDTRPTGFGGMNSRAWQPCGNETVLMDAATGEIVWSMRGEDPRGSEFAVVHGFAALTADATTIAFTDFNGIMYLADKTGKILARAKSIDQSRENRKTPTAGVGVWIASDGSFAVYAFKDFIVIGRGGKFNRVNVPDVVSGFIAGDNSRIVVGCDDGEVRAFLPDGKLAWTFSTGGVGALVAPAPNGQTYVATSLGELVLLNKPGKEARRVNLVEVADKEKHAITPADAAQKLPPPQDYHEPPTLEIARTQLKAKQIDAWKPADEGTRAFGKAFHKLDGTIEFAAPGKEAECFVHVVYRKPDGNPAITVATEGADGKQAFTLDLPTPEYRVADVPVRGPGAKVTVSAAGPVEIAECSFWTFQWFGVNLAYVRPAGSSDGPEGSLVEDEGKLPDLDSEMSLDEYGGTYGKLKDTRIWWPNTDIDKVVGPWLPSRCSPLDVVDSKRFNGGKLAPWAGEGAKAGNFAGAWFTLDFGKQIEFGLVATYDRAVKQSELATNVAILSSWEEEHSRIASGAVHNDQFWRLFLLPKEERLRVMGVLAFNGVVTGLSEVEVYSRHGLSK